MAVTRVSAKSRKLVKLQHCRPPVNGGQNVNEVQQEKLRREQRRLNSKGFGAIEVEDLQGHSWKVACMSCVRGHRTKHCGLPVCRSKIFWVVNRPGRPSIACTCKFPNIYPCMCAARQTPCPHKKEEGPGGKRVCRCDEQGRSCCYLGDNDWQALLTGETPRVQFYRSPEELRQQLSGTLALDSQWQDVAASPVNSDAYAFEQRSHSLAPRPSHTLRPLLQYKGRDASFRLACVEQHHHQPPKTLPQVLVGLQG